MIYATLPFLQHFLSPSLIVSSSFCLILQNFLSLKLSVFIAFSFPFSSLHRNIPEIGERFNYFLSFAHFATLEASEWPEVRAINDK